MLRRKFLMFWAALAGVAWMGLASPAYADFEVLFTVDRGAGKIDTVLFKVDGTKAGGGSVTASIAAGGSSNAKTGTFAVQVFATSGTDVSGASKLRITDDNVDKKGIPILFTLDGITVETSISRSNSPGTPSLAEIKFGNTTLNNTSGTGRVLQMTVGDTDFTQPKGTFVRVSASISATSSGTNTKSVTMTSDSYIDTTNKQFGTGGKLSPTLTTGALAKGTSGSDNVSNIKAGLPIPYSLTQAVKFDIGSKQQFVSAGGATDVTAVPAPPGVLLALSGLPILGLRFLRRRGKPAVA